MIPCALTYPEKISRRGARRKVRKGYSYFLPRLTRSLEDLQCFRSFNFALFALFASLREILGNKLTRIVKVPLRPTDRRLDNFLFLLNT